MLKCSLEIVDGFRGAGCQVQTDSENADRLCQWRNHHFHLDCTMSPNDGGYHRWCLRFDADMQPDVTIAVRMDAANNAPLDYYVLPRIDIETAKIQLAKRTASIWTDIVSTRWTRSTIILQPVVVAEAA